MRPLNVFSAFDGAGIGLLALKRAGSINSVYKSGQASCKVCDGYFKAKDKGKTKSGRVEAALDELLGKKSV